MKDLLNLTDKTALVCGASAGIGRATAFALADLGCRVICLARRQEHLKEVVSALPGQANHRFWTVDASQLTALDQTVDAIVEEIGSIDILINNSGGPAGGPMTDAEDDAFIACFRQHLLANHHLVQRLLPQMRKNKYGRIINIISTSVKAAIPGLGVSNTIRAAVNNWAKTLSHEVAADGITVNSVLPGFTDTGRLAAIIDKKAEQQNASRASVEAQMIASIPAKRLGLPEEVAAMVTFLATPAAAYVNGTAIAVDGGRTPCV